MTKPLQPMTPDERALAERLSRLGPHGEPSPALDARILAAAHAAASTPIQRQRPTRRWPLALGIAASLTLAVGIAWQLRPLQESPTYDEAASATAVPAEVAAPAEPAAVAAPGEQAPSDAAAINRAPAGQPSRESTNVGPVPRPAAPAARARILAPAPPPVEDPAVVFDAPSEPAPAITQAPIPAPAAAPVHAPAPAAPPPPAKAAPTETQVRAIERNSAAAGVAATSRESAVAEDAAAEDVPPATADSPEVREAWLQRIRELTQAGDAADARASLREFVHRYPNHPVPDDLRTLLE